MTQFEMIDRMQDLLPDQTFAESANLTQRLIEAGHLKPVETEGPAKESKDAHHP